MHAVVFHFQCGQLRTLPFALFQFAQRIVAVRLQMAQFVQFGVVAVVDDAAVFQPHGRLGQQSSLQQLGNALRFGKAACKRVQQAALRQMNILQDRQAVAQRRQIARPCRTQRNPRGNAFDVGNLFQAACNVIAAVSAQGFHRIQPRLNVRAVAQRMVQPMRQQAAAHVRHAVVQHRKQRGCRLPLQGLRDFQIAPRGRIHRHKLAFVFQHQRVHVRRQLVLRGFQIIEQRAGRRNRRRMLRQIQSERAQILTAEIIGQQGKRRIGRKLPMVQAAHGDFRAIFGQLERRIRQKLRHLQPRQFVRQPFNRNDFDAEFAAFQRRPSQCSLLFAGKQRGDSVGLLVFQQGRIRQRAGSNDAHDFALHHLARTHFANLFANRHAFAQLHQFHQILLRRVIRHARHFDGLAVALAARGERDVQQLRRLHRVVEKQFVKIAHAVKHQFVLVLGFNRKVLLHHGRKGFGRHKFSRYSCRPQILTVFAPPAHFPCRLLCGKSGTKKQPAPRQTTQ